MSEIDLGDVQLMTRTAAGEAAALETLYDRYASAVMGVALRITGDRTLSEEVVQETFWRVWQNAEAFRAQRGVFTSWLFSIARNLSIDVCRRRQVRPQPLLKDDNDQAIERVPDLETDVAEAAWLSIQHEQVRAALSNLPREQRHVIELAYFGGLTRQEIAAKIGEPLGTIHTRARLALKKLRELLVTQGFEA
ncbi:MAG TPA: sigma-70 family RNA polymerase sigma factor [Anaerolineae bacterium]|nr:sigma-70 family RNA polymerase sigma factor [Anaerolineae bacterium]